MLRAFLWVECEGNGECDVLVCVFICGHNEMYSIVTKSASEGKKNLGFRV